MHFEKYGINQITKLFEHYTREHITENVVQEKIKGNQYYFNANAKQYIDYYVNDKVEHKKSNALSEYCNREINDRTTRKLRADSVVMIDLIITQPEYLGKELDQKFFDTMQDTLKEKYIKENNYIMSAIHQDEQGQPHMHFSFIPIVQDKKKNNEKLCAKEFLTKDFLKSFHQEMEKKTGYKLTSEDKTIKNLSMQQYQNKKDMERLQNEIAEQKEKIKQLENEKEKNQDTISDYTKKIIQVATSKKIENGTTRYKDCDIKEIEYKEIPQPPMKKTILGETIDNEKINEWLHNTNDTIKKIFGNYAFNLANIKIKDSILNNKAKEYVSIDKKISELDTSNIKLKTENDTLKEKANKYDMLRAQYNSLANQWNDREQALDNMDLLDKVNNQVKMMHQQHNQGL